MTDITGFGLIGHAREMALASDVSLRLRATRIAALPGTMECIGAGYIPGGLNNNRDFAECVVEYEELVPDEVKSLLFDPQTAGGLLISLASEDAEKLLAAFHSAQVPANRIGEVVTRMKPLIAVIV
jgi:selenide, water dikinase